MAGVNISNAGLMFTRYLDGVTETLNHSSKARLLCKKDDKWTGDHIEWRVHVRRSNAVQYGEDGGAFPVADKQTYVTAKAYRKFLQSSIQLTDGVMATASKSKNVAKDVITSEVQGMMRDILKLENGMFLRDGTGSVAQLTEAAPAGTTVIVTDGRLLWEGASFDVYNSSGSDVAADLEFGATTPTGSSRGTVTISSVSPTPTAAGYATVELSSSITPLSATTYDHLVWKNSLNRCPTGLDKLIDDAATTFQNVNASTYPRFRSHVLSNSGTLRDLTPGLFRQMLTGLYQKGGERPADGLTVLTNSFQSMNVEELYEGELRLSPESKTGGLAAQSFQSGLGKVDIVIDPDAVYHNMYFVDFDKIYRAVQKPLDWRRQGGEIFLRSDVSGVRTATAMEICEFYIKERHTSGKIEDLNESASTAF